MSINFLYLEQMKGLMKDVHRKKIYKFIYLVINILKKEVKIYIIGIIISIYLYKNHMIK